MRPIEEIEKSLRLHIVMKSRLGIVGFFKHPQYKYGQMTIVASWDRDWEHVSVSLKNRCPTWEEMCAVKDIFWADDEAVMEIHPPKAEYVNIHPYCLHLWKPVNGEITRPPKELVY